jgi:hypothetical protein
MPLSLMSKRGIVVGSLCGRPRCLFGALKSGWHVTNTALVFQALAPNRLFLSSHLSLSGTHEKRR